MGRSLTVLGVIFLIVGFILIISGFSYKIKVVTSERSAGHGENGLEVSANLHAGRRLVLELTTGKDWHWWFEPWQGTDFPVQAGHNSVYVTVIDPHGGKTNITLYYVEVPTAGTILLAKFFGAVVTSNGGGLEMEGDWIIFEKNGTKYYNYKGRFGAVARFEGPYKVVITNGYEFGIPEKIEIIEQELREDKPYFFLVPIGLLMICFGFIVIKLERGARRKLRRRRVSKRVSNMSGKASVQIFPYKFGLRFGV